jgi:hypothetical protein
MTPGILAADLAAHLPAILLFVGVGASAAVVVVIAILAIRIGVGTAKSVVGRGVDEADWLESGRFGPGQRRVDAGESFDLEDFAE